MIITADQMATLKACATQNFAKRLSTYFENNFSGQMSHAGENISGGQDLDLNILGLIDAAARFGISSELGVGQFVAIGLGYSRRFYENERVAKMLGDPAFGPDQNIQRVLNAVISAEQRGR